MRGLPGSGKSTKVNQMIEELNIGPDEYVICSNDHFFMKNGEYVFVGDKIKQACEACWKKFVHAINNDIQYIFVDNTNTMYWEYERYVDYATKRLYMVEVVNLMDGGLTVEELTERNVHKVPSASIERMKARFQY
jgi:adenylate kinase family enzyme